MSRALLPLALACAGCVSQRERAPIEMPECLAWLRAGTTERAEIVEHFGVPRQSFEDGRILAWELDKDMHGVKDHWDRPYDLIVVFESADRVERASLVRSR